MDNPTPNPFRRKSVIPGRTPAPDQWNSNAQSSPPLIDGVLLNEAATYNSVADRRKWYQRKILMIPLMLLLALLSFISFITTTYGKNTQPTASAGGTGAPQTASTPVTVEEKTPSSKATVAQPKGEETPRAPIAPTHTLPPEPSPTPAQKEPAAQAPAPPPAPAGAPDDALTVLNTLKVQPESSGDGYSRDLFPHWLDTDNNGCDSDDDTYKRYANLEMANNCRESAGTMVDFYTGQTLTWGYKRSNITDVDHVVALKNAWQTGASGYSTEVRTQIANDPMNLLPVSASANREKSDKDSSEWLPPNTAFQCDYVAMQVGVKNKYSLWVTQPEKDAMTRVLSTCPGKKISAVEKVDVSQAPPPAPAPAKPAAPAPAKPAAPAPAGGTDPDYGTCKAAKANGKGPYYQGKDPEYEFYNDKDSDGVVCE